MPSLLDLFLSILAALGFLFALFSVGFWSLRLCFPQMDRRHILASMPVVGFGAASVWLNLISRVFSWNVAVYGWIVMGVVLGVVVFYRQGIKDVLSELSATSRWTILGIFFTFLALAFIGGVFDEDWHFPLAALIANGHWPASYPFDAAIPLVYHFSFDLIVAALAHIKVWIPIASDLMVALLETSFLFLAYVFVSSFLSEKWKRIGTVALWWLAGSFGWLIRPWRTSLPETLARIPPFTSTVGNAVGLLVNTKSQLFAFGFFLTLLLLREHLKVLNWKKVIFFAVGIAAMAISSETFFVFFVPCLFAVLFFEAPDFRSRGKWIITAALAALLVVFQGGIISDAVRHLFFSAHTAQATYTSFLLRESAIFGVFGGKVDLSSGWTWLRFIIEWGMQGFLFFFMFWRWKYLARFERGLLCAAAMYFAFPFIFVYPASPADILRMWGNAFFVTNLLGSIQLARSISSKRIFVGVVIIGSLSGLLSILFSQLPLISWMSHTRPIIVSTAFWPSFLRHEDQLPEFSRAWISVTKSDYLRDPALVRQIPVVFGVYGKSCHYLYNLSFLSQCDEFFYSPSEDNLKRLDVTHLVLKQEWADLHRHESWFSRLVLIKRFEPVRWTKAFTRFWSLDTSSYQLYEVH